MMQARIWRTPLIRSIGPPVGEPHRFLTVDGRIFTNLTGATAAAASNGLSIAITRAYLTSGLCQLYNESNQLPYVTKTCFCMHYRVITPVFSEVILATLKQRRLHAEPDLPIG